MVSTNPFAIEIDGHFISGLAAGEGERGVVVALHGGGYDARYWHGSAALSLLEAGAALGYRVLAVDRPGYRGSVGAIAEGYSLSRQADLIFDLIDRVTDDAQLPVFVIGHSMGGILALLMAADQRASRLAAIDVSGVPLRYPDEMLPIIERARAGAQAELLAAVPDLGKEARRWMFYSGKDTFDASLVDPIDGVNAVPPGEMADAYNAPEILPALMSAITLPVQWTIAADERSSVGGQGMLDEITALLTSCPYLRTTLQTASGHNISLHHVGRAYHLRALAFFDECHALRYSAPAAR